MAVIIPPGFAQCAYILTGPEGTQPFVTTMGLDISGAGGDLEAAANAAGAAYVTNIMSRTSSTLTLEEIQLAVGQDGGGSGTFVLLSGVAGSLGGADAPIAMAVIAQKQTSGLGRGSRGRMFLPGLLANEDVDRDGRYSSATFNAIQADVEGYYQDLVDSTEVEPVLLHSEPGPSTPTPITGMRIAPQVGWLRKRLR